MKNGIVLFLSMLVCLSLLSQNNTSDNQYRYGKYMRRSHRQMTAGIIFLSSGAAVTAGGIALIVDGNRRNNNNQYSSEGDGLEQALGIVTTVMGAGFMGGSIPFFIGARKSRERAMSFSFKAESTTLPYKSAFSMQKFPALALHIPLGR